MLGAIYVGLSGMAAYSKGLLTISNNVANLNTPGFKSSSVNFADVFNQGGGGLSYTGSEQSVGTGVRFGTPVVDFRQGDLRQSDGDLDLAIQGNGFMVLQSGDKNVYARTGQFVVDEDGYISLQGTDHHLTVLDSARQPTVLNIDAKRTRAPVATTKITFADNLSSSSTTDPIVSNIAVYDATGGKRVWQVKFTPVSGSPGEYTVSVTDDQNAAVGSSATLKFNNGVVDASTSTLTIDGIVLDFSTGVTNYSGGTSTLRAAKVDGSAVGSLTNVTVDEEGQVKLTYSNSEKELVGAIAMADFRDPQQLERIGNGLFENTGKGQYRLLPSNTDGIGKLVSKQLEASNVDLSAEFGDLILVQRGFQASSQVVSVSNDMIQQLFGIRGQG